MLTRYNQIEAVSFFVCSVTHHHLNILSVFVCCERNFFRRRVYGCTPTIHRRSFPSFGVRDGRRRCIGRRCLFFFCVRKREMNRLLISSECYTQDKRTQPEKDFRIWINRQSVTYVPRSREPNCVSKEKGRHKDYHQSVGSG